jgi:hypothetical protein
MSFLTEVSLVERHGEMTADFSARALRLRQELKKLLVSAALEALGDVGHDGHRSPTHLFPELTVPEKSRIRRDLVDRSCQGASRLPDIQLFKTVDGSQADPLC